MTEMAHADQAYRPGLADPVFDSQAVFRAVLDAMARPGRIADLPIQMEGPRPLHDSAAAVCLTLLDLDTPLWLDGAADQPGVREYLRFHCGCPITGDAGGAAFAVVADPAGMTDLALFPTGTPEYPDRSATLILQVPCLGAGRTLQLSGPGIEGATELRVDGVPKALWEAVQANHALYPCGLDFILAAPGRLAALPRSTKVEV